MADAALAAFFSSVSVLVFPLMVTYLGSNPFSTSTPSSRVGRSRRWPMVARTSYPEPRYFPMVLALVGDSTMTRAGRPSRTRAPFPRTLLFLGAATGAGRAEALVDLFRVPTSRSGRAFLFRV